MKTQPIQNCPGSRQPAQSLSEARTHGSCPACGDVLRVFLNGTLRTHGRPAATDPAAAFRVSESARNR
jgi:hypothetical protein